MALPLVPNTTCDIYRAGVTPPAAPAAGNIRCHFRPAPAPAAAKLETPVGTILYTHVLLVEAAVDIRDPYVGAGGSGSPEDGVYVPAGAASPRYQVVFVDRVGRGGPNDHKRVFLERQAPAWPSDNL
jgi:hypothetical protein